MITHGETRHGTPRAAFAHRAYRWIFLGSFASNIGTWMQNVALLAFADDISRSSAYVGIITFAQLGPMLFLSPFAGLLADAVDRKRLMITAAAVQGAMSVALAAVASSDQPNQVFIVLCVLGIGIAAAVNGPAAQATLPALVPRADLSGAVALNSAQMNASRVLGPLLAVIPFLHSPSVVFLFNAATYLFVIAAVSIVKFDSLPVPHANTEGPLHKVMGGVRAARENPVIGRALITVSVFSLFSLVFIYQMAGFARERLELPDERFRLLFGSFGLGAAIGAIAVGTRLRGVDRTVLVRWGLAGFAVSLAAFGLLTTPGPAYVLVALTGFGYFVVITALSTAIQHEVTDAARGRVMGLWMMAWAGLVPVGSLFAGFVIDSTGYPPILLGGAVVAAALIPVANLRGATPEPPDPAPQSDFL